jgi:DNA-binding LytR/AlgR family response regulator
MKLRALIVDDEAPARSELRYMLEKMDGIDVVGESANAKEALKLIKALKHDVIFLDIQMPGLTGLDVAEALRKLPSPPALVFVTAYDEHAVKAFELEATDYLLKPFDEKRLRQTLNKLAKLKGKRRHLETSGESPVFLDKVPVEKAGKTLLLDLEDIVYADIRYGYAHVHTFDDIYLTNFTLGELEERLKKKQFFRTHRTYLVNLNKAKEIVPLFKGNCLLRVADNKTTEIPVSRRQARKLRAMLGM